MLAKVTLVKVVNYDTSVVMWLHILVNPCWCVSPCSEVVCFRRVQHTHTIKNLLIYAATSPPV